MEMSIKDLTYLSAGLDPRQEPRWGKGMGIDLTPGHLLAEEMEELAPCTPDTVPDRGRGVSGGALAVRGGPPVESGQMAQQARRDISGTLCVGITGEFTMSYRWRTSLIVLF